MSDEKEIFDGKTFQDLTKDIYENSQKKKLQIDLLIQEIHGFIQTIDDVVMVAPIIKEYMDASIKNDEHLVKLASVWQRIIGKTNNSEDGMLLSESEKEDLIAALQDDVDDIQKKAEKIKQEKSSQSSSFEA